jgi:hypothetical protein
VDRLNSAVGILLLYTRFVGKVGQYDMGVSLGAVALIVVIAPPTLRRDVASCIAFFARQVSLSRLGKQQAVLDLAIRRAIGQHATEVSAPGEVAGGGAVVSLTAELY